MRSILPNIKKELINLGKIRAYLLLRNREIKTLTVDHSKSFFIFKKGLYNVSSDIVGLDPLDRPELYYFENLPTPINPANKDAGSEYLDDRVASNLLEQLIPEAKQGSGIGEFFDYILGDPRRVIMLILGLSVLWAVLTSGGV